MKKGFTLIELLAVIVILAIIALIATPIILGVVENARKSAAGSSALGYIDAVEKEIALGGFNENIYPTGKVDITSTSPYNTIEVNGSMPSKGTLNITDNYIVETSVLCINKYKVEVVGHKVSKITKNACDDMETPLPPNPPEPPVEDKTPKFSGVEDIEVPQWTKFDPFEGVTATDSEGKDITGRIDVDRGGFTTAITGTYTLTYTVSDEEGNEATAERKITVIPSEYIDNSHAATPNLKGGLIPVTLDEYGTVHKADPTSRWYDYDEKKWANAIILYDNIIPDVSGNGNHGYLQGATKNAGSVTTDGVDDYVYAGLPNYDFKDEFSMAIRVKFNQYVGNVFENAEGSGISIVGNSSHKLYLQVMNKTDNQYVVATSDTEYSLNTWYTVVGTLKDSKLHLYINGKEATTPVSFNGEIKASTLALLIASNPQGSSCNTTNHTCTNVDPSALEFTDALIFDRALTSDEIAKEFSDKITNVSNTENMLLRYELDDQIPNNTVLPEEVIESYFVWIPKYRYQLWDLGQYTSASSTDGPSVAKEIKIEFNTEDTVDSATTCKTPMLSGETGECEVDKWMTHPAFISFGVDGLWVGKFETTGTLAKVTVKPSVASLRNQTLKQFFDAAYNYSRNDLDSHMAKNTEWGAMAYLSHSKYGINKEVVNNSSSTYLTGYGSGSKASYTTDDGKLASTTGNITGIYDMSGCGWELTAGYAANQYGSSGFNATNITKYENYENYFDVYNITNYSGRILGDATGEMGPFINYGQNSWYTDYSYFVNNLTPWFNRGGLYNYGSIGGQFCFTTKTGGAKDPEGWDANCAFRLILAPK